MAEDQFELFLFEASYDDIVIDVLSTDDDISRTQVAHEFAFRDGAVLQDTGAVPRETRCEIVFMRRGSEGLDNSVLDAFTAFATHLEFVAAEQIAKTFIHPLTGAYEALPRDISFRGSSADRDFVSLSVTFVEAGLDPALFENRSIETETVGAAVAAVGSALLELNTSLAEAPSPLPATTDSPATVGTDSLTTAQGWQADAAKTQRQINLELNALSTRIDDSVDALELATDVGQYPTLLAMQRLHGSLRRAAAAAIRTAPKLTEFTNPRTVPLMTLLSSFYGDGQKAVDRFARTLELNDIQNPAIVPAGTVLALEVA